MILVIWGVVLLASFVVAMSCLFDLDGGQKMALRHIQINRKAGKAILIGFKYFIARKRLHMLKARQTQYLSKDEQFSSKLVEMLHMQAANVAKKIEEYKRKNNMEEGEENIKTPFLGQYENTFQTQNDAYNRLSVTDKMV